MLSIIAAILVLGVLIVVHEFGHFIVAKLLGVGVIKFSVGFGPRLFGRKIEDTEYVISAIPLGGFVKMVGEDPDSDEPVDEKISFSHQSLWKRSAIVLAGPAFNLIFAFLAFTGLFIAYGIPSASEEARVGVVQEGMPADKAGFAIDDLVTAIDGEPIGSWAELSEVIRGSDGGPLSVTVVRGEETVMLEVTPEERDTRNVYGEIVGPTYYAVGIMVAGVYRPAGIAESVWLGATRTGLWIETMVVSVYKLISGDIGAGEIGGPILIVQEAGARARVGIEALVGFMALISINLGIINLLPIPILDGGHLLFFLLEAVMRRPLDLRQREMAQQVGLVILISLMAFAFYNDFGRLISSWG
jgi:regulator of sigma E protease